MMVCRLRMLIVFLVLGAIVNVAVAWILALTVYESVQPILVQNGAGSRLQQAFGKRVGIALEVEDQTWAVDRLLALGFIYNFTHNETFSLYRVTSGIPLRSMTGVHYTMKENQWWQRAVVMSTPTPNQAGLYQSKIIPLQPIWPGFAINAIFYAAILWGLFAIPFKVRRHRRIKRGLCPACAYPVGTSPICTECGAPIVCPRTRSAEF